MLLCENQSSSSCPLRRLITCKSAQLSLATVAILLAMNHQVKAHLLNRWCCQTIIIEKGKTEKINPCVHFRYDFLRLKLFKNFPTRKRQR